MLLRLAKDKKKFPLRSPDDSQQHGPKWRFVTLIQPEQLFDADNTDNTCQQQDGYRDQGRNQPGLERI